MFSERGKSPILKIITIICNCGDKRGDETNLFKNMLGEMENFLFNLISLCQHDGLLPE